MNEQGNQLGEEAVSALVKANGNLSASDLERSIVTAADTFRGAAEQHDDITLVIVKSK
jgi:serine phosphatase RsbU (regulator of sigma subunit)